VIAHEKLADNARQIGDYLKTGLLRVAKRYPQVIQTVRGLGLMLGLELAPNISNLPGEAGKTQAVRFAHLLHTAGMLLVPAGAQILRLLPPLNLTRTEADEGLDILETVAARLAPSSD